MTKHDLQKKVWFRLMKVIYGLTIFFVIMITAMLFIASFPKKDFVDTQESKMYCSTSHKFYRLKELGVSDILNGEYISISDASKIKAVCPDTVTNNHVGNHTFNIGDVQENYTLDLVYEYRSSPTEWFTWLVIFIVGYLLIYVFIKRIFFYIVTGSPLINPPQED